MPTIIDELVIKLGLDASKFTKDQQEAVDKFRKNVEGIKKGGDQTEDVAKKLDQAFSRATNRVLGFGAALLGAGSVVEFIKNVTHTDLAVGRLATQLDANLSSLSKWRNVAKITGGSAEGMGNSVKNLVQNFQQFSLTGESSIIPYFRTLGVDISDAAGNMRKFDDIMLDVADKFSRMDPAKAAFFGHALGFDEGTIALLIRGREAVKGLLDQAEELGTITKKDEQAAKDLTEAWNKASTAAVSLGRDMATRATPAMVGFLDRVQRAFSWVREQGEEPTTFNSRFRGSTPMNNDFGYHPPSRAEAAKTALTGSGGGAMSKTEMEAYIIAAAKKRGIDPNIALAVARSEGLSSYVGDRGSSFGPFQLHYGGVASGGMAASGLGDEFTKKTGLNARDPATTKQQIDFALDQASRGGWGPWHGWRGAPFAGIGGGGGSHSEVHIDKLIVNSAATDAPGIASDIRQAVGRESFAQQANAGPQ